MFSLGKSKQNASQRNKDGGKQQLSQQHHQQQSHHNQKQQQHQQQQQQQQQPTVPVPQSQPPKPNNKSSKMKDINTKGASKEGTDMDAFNDNAPSQITVAAAGAATANITSAAAATTATDVVNANVAPSVIANDNFNSNQVIVNANNTNVNNTAVTTNNKRTENSDVISKTETKPLPVISKGKVDVTSIVRDNPKTGKASVVSQPTDETDNATVLPTEKLVQVKNEVNAKSTKENVDTSNIMKERLNLPYKKGNLPHCTHCTFCL